MININEIIQDNEMEQLLIIGESFNKQLLLNDIYMEEDSSNNIKGVNFLQKFWNWLKRIMYKIRMTYEHFVTTKTIDKIIKRLDNKYRDNDELNLPKETYETITGMITLNGDIGNISSFNPNMNYQKEMEYMKKMTSLGERLKSAINDRDPMDTDVMENQIGVKVYAIKKTFKEFQKVLLRAKEDTVNVDKIINDEKAKVGEEVAKSNKFQQYIQYLTYGAKGDLYIMKTLKIWCKELNFILSGVGQEFFKSYMKTDDYNREIKDIYEINKDSVTGSLRDYIVDLFKRTEAEEIYMEYLNRSDDKHLDYVEKHHPKSFNRDELKTHEILIAYAPDKKSGKWIRSFIKVDKNNPGEMAVLKKLFVGDKMELNDITQGETLAFVIKK